MVAVRSSRLHKVRSIQQCAHAAVPVLLLRKLRTVLLVRMRQDALAALEYGIASQVDRLTHCSHSHCYEDTRFGHGEAPVEEEQPDQQIRSTPTCARRTARHA